ncbi:hypothetical protein LEP1GSC036_4240 [Leptospira weilii str. 2006001853]|uniref:Uncharacterized protein n=1 Tax=Leptospira weilii str. 2006001853 TaxID=1001589 RepID=A0A828Z0D9_9LEPT|nr:hypothetical protein LEP1GSC036_4240 [Leptospira weilii str. 2006001853]EMN46314.1 hypothetical protein LEP1GSC086_3267 [Leptospira weilii str. LNT 1234]
MSNDPGNSANTSFVNRHSGEVLCGIGQCSPVLFQFAQK